MCLGIPGRITHLCPEDPGMAIVDISGVKRKINITCIITEDHPPEQCIDDWVLIHVGFAMSKIDQEEALHTLELLSEFGEVQEELNSISQSDNTMAENAIDGGMQ